MFDVWLQRPQAIMSRGNSRSDLPEGSDHAAALAEKDQQKLRRASTGKETLFSGRCALQKSPAVPLFCLVCRGCAVVAGSANTDVWQHCCATCRACMCSLHCVPGWRDRDSRQLKRSYTDGSEQLIAPLLLEEEDGDANAAADHD